MARALSDSDPPNALTLAALGILAFVSQTLIHEAVGHGSLCVLLGGKIVLIAPFYMQCTIQPSLMVAAGPGMNLVAGLVSYLLLRRASGSVGPAIYWLWLFFLQNWLVAAGYLLVGAASTFGDWGVLFDGIHPSLLWRIPAGAVAALFYRVTLNLGERSFAAIGGHQRLDLATRARLFLLPMSAAAVVAVAAQLYGQGTDLLGIALALGCTLVVGLTMMTIDRAVVQMPERALALPFSPTIVSLGFAVGLAFVLLVGPGLRVAPH